MTRDLDSESHDKKIQLEISGSIMHLGVVKNFVELTLHLVTVSTLLTRNDRNGVLGRTYLI